MSDAVVSEIEVPLEPLILKLPDLAREYFIPENDARDLLIRGWETAVEHFLGDGALSPNEESKLLLLAHQFQLSEGELDRNGAFSRVAKARVIRDILKGNVPGQLTAKKEDLPFNFQKAERLVWVFNSVQYLEDRSKIKYEGGSHGVSFRLMRGVYYRVGAHKGEAVRRTERLHVDTGTLAVTDKNIYFSGPSKSFRIAHSNIVSLTPYRDAVAIVRDSATAMPQIFVTGDGWFAHNVLANVAHLDS
ncbi:MAG: hypothetical protein A3G24_28905 [Betaproteobacteria bacterium RIFCSPLOWO2_12_FULL_62_13]|nr:MAG: hypothetical protein A3G24_28905 [Betaproteobacteria bacterium RIFCSPLOWO2_12_FULL_62_13]